jgi:hypothetical protein
MKPDTRIGADIEATRMRERQTACCIRNDNSGCVQTSRAECSVKLNLITDFKNLFSKLLQNIFSSVILFLLFIQIEWAGGAGLGWAGQHFHSFVEKWDGINFNVIKICCFRVSY